MIAPNPFFPQFNHMRYNNNNIHNFSNNFKGSTQTPYAHSANLGSYKNNTYNNNPKSNNLGSNFSHSSNNFSNTFNMDNIEKETKQNEQFFEIFGIKLYFDDLLIIALLFFLYKEECTDDSLFIILILLLLS